MTLLEDIKSFKEKFKQNAPQEKQELMKRATEELEKSGVAKGLKEGERIPRFQLSDATGRMVSIDEELSKGPMILTFYRGGWCPYCNLELRAYQKELQSINNAGIQLVAISPQTPDASLSTKEKNELAFTVLSDEGNEVANQFNLVFQMPDYLVEVYKESGLDVPAHNGNDNWELPKPATFVVDQSGKIVYAEVHSDYTVRVEPLKVVELAKNI
ncbi:peroxiredoxin-like family protein [Bacillus carboniphilus]|uniref:thioredoxin-dependent peroxiredoxin n=1 Tax=Bacillus carboniphilus TaxID=86663 RepID=A0ABY9JRX1_9BACI|nr:peroxiredoxin-like family protein [Bacillus carboniphilus]WLR42157.1 peroxiredoxin-like family protein [Bacillus carboniphilus]